MSEDGSDESPVRPVRRRIKKVMVVSSASESDSDSSVGPTATRRRRLRALSDDGGSDSSGSSVGARPKRTLPVLRDSDAGSDSSGWASQPSRPTPSSTKPNSGFASDSSEGNSDKCSICLLRFKEQEVGTPEACEHIFCLDCITEWSKNVNTCPVDRITFNSIVVRSRAGGRVLRTEPVKLEERRPSVEFLVIEDHTQCEVCGGTENEESMLLCDGCDLGYHMQCLTPPLTEIPLDHWLCPNCDDLLEEVHDLSELDDLFEEVIDLGALGNLGPRPSALRQPRNVRRSQRNRSAASEPSTSTGRRGGGEAAVEEAPSTSRGALRGARPVPRARSRRTTTGTKRRRYKRRRTTKTIIIEYDVEENGKFPVTKTVKRKIKKRKSRKKPTRTAARRSHVLASVRARLASQRPEGPGAAHAAAGAAEPVSELRARRRRAGIPSLSLFGDPYQLDYFSEEEVDIFEGATAAVAMRPASSVASAYRQARRKMISIPSPPHAAAAPDLLANIMESQALLHSKRSIVSVSVDGRLDIKPKPNRETRQDPTIKSDKSTNKDDRVNLSKGEDAAKKAPSYPGKGRSGGWGGGYRGNYHREHGTGNHFSRGYETGGGPPRAPGLPHGAGGGMRRDDDAFDTHFQRLHQYYDDDYQYDRSRRPLDNARGPNYPNQRMEHGPRDIGRGSNYSNQRHEQESPDMGRAPDYSPQHPHGPFDSGRGPSYPNQRHEHGPSDSDRGLYPNQRYEQGPLDTGRGSNYPNQRHEQGRYSLDSSWQPQGGPAGRLQEIPTQTRHSFGVLEDALDMRTGHAAPGEPVGAAHHSLPQPPVFGDDPARDVDEDEDEKSDPGLVIDTDKYDPTDPTQDSDDEKTRARASPRVLKSPVSTPALTLSLSSPPALAAPPSPPVSSPPSPTLISPPASPALLAPPAHLLLEESDAHTPIVLSCKAEPGSPLSPPPTVPPLLAPPSPPVPPLLAPPSPPVFPLSAPPSPSRLELRAPPSPPPLMQNILAGIDTSSLNVPANVLDDAVRQVLQEHRNLIAPPAVRSQSDDDSDGDCPNFSIYSATSVHIASGTAILPPEPREATPDNLDEDLVQQDDLPSPAGEPEHEDAPSVVAPSTQQDAPSVVAPSTQQDKEYRVMSKKCPITSNTRNPIKIKLQSQSLIKRNVSLYDEEDDPPVDIESGKGETASEANEANMWSFRSPKKKSERNSKKDSTKKDIPNKDSSNIGGASQNNVRKKDGGKSKASKNNEKVSDSPERAHKQTVEKEDTEVNASKNNPQTEDSNVSQNIVGKEDANKDDDIKTKDTTKDKGTHRGVKTLFGDESADEAEEGLTPDHKVCDDVYISQTAELDTINDEDINSHGDLVTSDGNKSGKESLLEESEDDTSDRELGPISQKTKQASADQSEETVEKMTESISETEDERSYTPCLDENKSKDLLDADKGIEGLDTEMISEEEGNDIFSDGERAQQAGRLLAVLARAPSPAPAPPAHERTATPLEDAPAKPDADGKKKKKKDSKKEAKGKTKKAVVTFKKLTKSGKERNYRERDKEEKRSKRERREAEEAAERRRRKERRKDLERYDVRSVVTEKRRKGKDAFGRDVSPRRSRSASGGAASGSPPARRRARSPSAPPAQRAPPSPLRRSPLRRSPLRKRKRSLTPRRRSITPRQKSVSPRRRSITPRRRSGSPLRRSISPRQRFISPRRRSISPFDRSISARRKSISPLRRPISLHRSISPYARRSISPRRISPRRKSITPRRMPISPRRKSISPRRRSGSRGRKPSPRRVGRKRVRRSASRSTKLKPTKKKKRSRSERPPSKRRKTKKKRTKRVNRSPEPSPPLPAVEWSPPSVDSRLLSPRTPPAMRAMLSPLPDESGRRPPLADFHWRNPEQPRYRKRTKDTGPSKEVFTSGDNILVSVSFKDAEQEKDAAEKRKRKESKRDKRWRRRRAGAAEGEPSNKPVAIIDLDRSPFREVTPSPKNIIVLSDDDHGDKEKERAAPPPAAPEPQPQPTFAVGPKTPPEPGLGIKFSLPAKPAGGPRAPNPLREPEEAEPAAAAGPSTPPDPEPDSPDAYDPFEPTRSASASPRAAHPPHAAPASPPRAHMTLEAAQKTNMSADDVIDRRPISPIEKVLALLKSTRNVTPDKLPGSPGASPVPADAPPATDPAAAAPVGAAPPPLATAPAAPPAAAPAPPVRIVLPSPTRAPPPKLFLAKPSPIKSNPVKPMQATKISRLPLPLPRRPPPELEMSPDVDSPYSPGSEDFCDLFSPPTPPGSGRQPATKGDIFDELFNKPPKGRKKGTNVAKVPVKLKKKGKTQVGVTIDENSLKIMDDLPSSAVEMQVKSKFLKKLNRQERVVEEVKLVLKPHYNKKHITKEEYKDIMRRAVPKICHNKTGEINPTKIQSLVEAYVKKCRKRHKLGLV